MFNSNVAPRKRKTDLRDWFCELCSKTVKKYHRVCPSCGNTRPD